MINDEGWGGGDCDLLSSQEPIQYGLGNEII
jgi:hypothetical protein